MENVNQIRLPSDMQGLPFDQAYDSIRERRKTLPDDLKAVRVELETMSAKWYLRLATIRDVLTDKIDEIAAIPKFGQTEYAFVITGWILSRTSPSSRGRCRRRSAWTSSCRARRSWRRTSPTRR